MTDAAEELAVDLGRETLGDLALAESREWIVTNGTGSYASATIAGSLTRRYHGLLVAAKQPPVGRTLLVAKIDETVDAGSGPVELGTNRWLGDTIAPGGFIALERFRLDGTIPVWTFAVDDALLEKRIWMEHVRNVTNVEYRLIRGSRPLRLRSRVLVNYRDFHATTHAGDWRMDISAGAGALRIVPFAGAPPTWIAVDRGQLDAEHAWWRNFWLAREFERGLDCVEDHLLAAVHEVAFEKVGVAVRIVFSDEAEAPSIDAASLERRRSRDRELVAGARVALSGGDELPAWIEQLVLAADAFVVARPIASDPGAASIIAGYHWFGDWGRDTMIALPGLTLTVGRADVAARILRTFARFIDGGMLPNYFPDSGGGAEYNTVDAALWYVEAVRAYDETTGDPQLARDVFAALVSIVDAYERGTRYHIGLDGRDGLVFAGEPGVQLTWMDAKVGDWVVTPRIGKAVEINALWYNALRTLEAFAHRDGQTAAGERFGQLADRCATGFERFWNSDSGSCFDVLDGPSGHDPTFRPNALLAAALPYSPLSLERRRAVVDACGQRLLTSYGLRSLARADPSYRGAYSGTVSERDGTYHQGTAWGWLIGPWIAALLRCGTAPEVARSYLEPFRHHIGRYGVGSLAEIADGDAPFAPNGCIAQAWTVAQVLTAWHATNVGAVVAE